MTVTEKGVERPQAFRRFAEMCRASAPGDEAKRLQQALALAHPGKSPALFQVMIAAGAFESAALALIGKDCAFMLSRSAEGRCFATVLSPRMKAEVSGEGATPALALLTAWAGALMPAANSRKSPDVTRPAGVRLH